MKTYILLVFLSFLLLFSVCKKENNGLEISNKGDNGEMEISNTDLPLLSARTWKFLGIINNNYKVVERVPEDIGEMNATFKTNLKLQAKSSMNYFGGIFILYKNNVIKFDSLGSTLMGCFTLRSTQKNKADCETLNKWEHIYWDGFVTATAYYILNDSLSIINEFGDAMLFKAK